MLRGFSSVAIVTFILSIPGVASAQFSSSGFSTSGFVPSQPVPLNPTVPVAPQTSYGVVPSVIFVPGVPGVKPILIKQPYVILPTPPLSSVTYGVTYQTVAPQIYTIPDASDLYSAPIYPTSQIIPNGIVTEVENPYAQSVIPTAPLTQTVAPIPAAFTRTAIARQLLSAPGVVRLDAELLEATCSQNWQKAIGIMNRVIDDTPQDQFVYRSQLQDYRNRLQALARSKTVAPSWRAQCTGG